MKRSLKKIIGVLVLALCMFAMTACGAKEALPNEEIYRLKSDQYVEVLTSMERSALDAMVSELEESYDDFEQQVELYPYIGGTGQKFDFTAEAYLGLFKSYAGNLDELGAYIGIKEYEGGETNEDGETSYSTVYDFEEHDMRLSLVFNEDNVIVSVTADPIYSPLEIIQKAGMNTLIGMGVVFVVLILISLIISCFGFIPKLEAMFRKDKNIPAETPKAVPKAAPAPAPAAPVPAAGPVQAADDLELVAVITAAVAAAMGTSADGFVVRSIKRRDTNKWKRA